MSSLRFTLSAALLLAACGSEPPSVPLTLREGNTRISELQRLLLIVRECNEPRLALRTDLIALTRDQTVRFDAAVVPGRTFYVWVQGWKECTPPMGEACVPEVDADVRQCACIPDGTMQEFFSQACTRWIRAEDSPGSALTLKEIPLNPAERTDECPPPPLSDCNVLE